MPSIHHKYLTSHSGPLEVDSSLLSVAYMRRWIPIFGIRARATLSCVGGRNAGSYGCNLASAVQAPMHSVAYMYMKRYNNVYLYFYRGW